jgi:hypothetical protein
LFVFAFDAADTLFWRLRPRPLATVLEIRSLPTADCGSPRIEAAAASAAHAAQAGRQQQVAATDSHRQMPANTNDMLYEKREFLRRRLR